MWSLRRRLSGRRRLAAGLLLLGLAVVVAIGAGRFLGASGAGGLAASLWRILGVRVEAPAPTEGPSAAPGGASGQGEPLAVAADTVFLWSVVYETCGCTTWDPAPAPEGTIGLSREALAVELRDWEVTAFAPERVELRRSETGAMCLAHGKRTLRLEAGKLILYAGALDDPTVTLIPIGDPLTAGSGLSAAEAEILKTGKVFENQDEVFQFLEGLGD